MSVKLDDDYWGHWQRDATRFRYEFRASMALRYTTVQEPKAKSFDDLSHTNEMILRLATPYSRMWWRALRHHVRLCFLAEYHRAAGTERTYQRATSDRAFSVITGITS